MPFARFVDYVSSWLVWRRLWLSWFVWSLSLYSLRLWWPPWSALRTSLDNPPPKKQGIKPRTLEFPFPAFQFDRNQSGSWLRCLEKICPGSIHSSQPQKHLETLRNPMQQALHALEPNPKSLLAPPRTLQNSPEPIENPQNRSLKPSGTFPRFSGLRGFGRRPHRTLLGGKKKHQKRKQQNAGFLGAGQNLPGFAPRTWCSPCPRSSRRDPLTLKAMVVKLNGATQKWAWLKIQRSEGQAAGFGSMFPLARVPFWYRFCEPQPSDWRT